jgi:DNA-binding CsgD family transcriptional regulator
VLRDYADLTPEGRRFAAALKASAGDAHPWPGPPDGAVVSAGTVNEVLNAEAILPSTIGDPVGWWYVVDWGPPFTYIAGSILPPAEGEQRRWQIKSAITAAVADDAYFRTRPGLPGSRERQAPLLENAAGSGYRGRSLSAMAQKEGAIQRKTRRKHLENDALTLDEYGRLSIEKLFELNLIQWGSVPWLLELETSPKSGQVFAPQRRHGRRSKYYVADPTGEAAVAFASATSLPLAALSYGVEGMSFARPFADVDAARGDLSYETAGQVVLDRWLAAGMTERQAIVLLNVQAGWTAEQIHEVLNIARPTVAAHLAAARRILKRISEIVD